MHCPWVHSDELREFIPPLMLSTFELIVFNICFDWPFACRANFIIEAWEQNHHHFNKIIEDPMVAKLTLSSQGPRQLMKQN